MSSNIVVRSLYFCVLALMQFANLVLGGEGEPFYTNNTQGQKNYEEDEEGKILPSR